MAEPFTLFVSCVEGKPVTRWGTRTFIGADRIEGTNQIVWHPERVVAIPRNEHDRYRKEYNRLLNDRELVVRTEDDWLQQALEDEQAAQANEAAKKSAAEAAAPKE